MRKVESGARFLPSRPERRRQVRAMLVFAVAYALVCAIVAAPRGYFTETHLAAEPVAGSATVTR